MESFFFLWVFKFHVKAKKIQFSPSLSTNFVHTYIIWVPSGRTCLIRPSRAVLPLEILRIEIPVDCGVLHHLQALNEVRLSSPSSSPSSSFPRAFFVRQKAESVSSIPPDRSICKTAPAPWLARKNFPGNKSRRETAFLQDLPRHPSPLFHLSERNSWISRGNRVNNFG